MKTSTSNLIKLKLISALQWLIFVYLALRLYFFHLATDTSFTIFCGVIFLGAEFFVLFQALGFINYLKIVILRGEVGVVHPPKLKSFPPIACVVASYKEPLQVIEETLLCLRNMTYPNKQVYLLDDTRYDQEWASEEEKEKYKRDVEALCRSLDVNLFRHEWRHAKAGIINDWIRCRHGEVEDGFQLTFFSEAPPKETEKYVAVFDADMNPMPDFADPLVSILENNPSVAYVQTPQYYTNFKANRVARAASLMQAIFYEYICEAKGIDKIMLLCGTNVLIRLAALREVGGMDCNTVTEDFATGFKMNLGGWDSLYFKKVSAFGMGPEDLGGLFKQQFRWASGTVGLLSGLFLKFLRHPFKIPFHTYLEYFLSSSYYLIGWVYFVFMLGPSMYLFFDMPIYMMPSVLYFCLLIPYNIAINVLFYWAHAGRKYKILDLFNGVVLGIVNMPVYMKASLMALLGRKGHFVVTPKGESSVLPISDLWPQIIMGVITFSTITYGVLRLVFEGAPAVGICVNLFWSVYYFAIFSSTFYYNMPVEEPALETEESPQCAG